MFKNCNGKILIAIFVNRSASRAVFGLLSLILKPKVIHKNSIDFSIVVSHPVSIYFVFAYRIIIVLLIIYNTVFLKYSKLV